MTDPDSPNTPVALRAVKLLASFMADPSTKELALMQMQEWMTDPVASNTATLQLISAILYMHDDNIKDAIKVIRHGVSMEQCALLVQLYLRIDRLDLAQKQVKLMKGTDEDHTLTMLASAWTMLAQGSKAVDATYVYEELADKYSPSPLLMNGLAVAKMQQGLYEEAESHLQDALAKAQSDPDSLANLVCVGQHLQRPPEVIARYLSQLKMKAPSHPLLSSLSIFESAFDRVSTSMLK
mmetsp:Transcript_36745/g.37398  ORF Transcript_36745/g.37398 Transcript_36745/m.37398 type:complete len:238 (+) Transcript_36745:3-716(+)